MNAEHFLQSSQFTGPVVDLNWLDIGLAFGLILIAAGLSRWQRTGLSRDIITGAIRAIAQLVLVGYVLVYIFELRHWIPVVTALVVMLAAATWEAVRRQTKRDVTLSRILGFAMLIGSALTLIYIGSVVRFEPWYNPRYIIPLFGMIVGNVMNTAALAAERLASEVETRRAEIEAYLVLGAAPSFATREAVRRAIRASMIPMVNSLAVVGLVALPGMMTGQIIAGASPVTAIRYQIVVMFVLMAAVAITGTIGTLRLRQTFFTPADQLR